MNAERLLAEYARIADAPDAVARLRSFIRNLAMRGKLVPQCPDDAPVPFRNQRIDAATSSETPFAIPLSWKWTDVRSVGEARLGKMLDKAKNKGTPRPYLRNINVRWFDFDLSDILEMPFEESELSEFALRVGDVLICEGGEPGRAAVWDGRVAGLYFQKAIHRVRFQPLVNPAFFVNALRASADDGRLAQSFTGTGIKHFTGKSLDGFCFPLPPLAEQHRIVAKVDELMALCDRLEAARKGREAARDRLAAASLARLNTPDPETFQDDARFALTALPALTTRPDQIKHLRQTILNLAVRGKLVPQDPCDEPAAKLLAYIERTKQQLYREKRIPKPKVLPPLDDVGAPFDVPVGWSWAMLGDLCYSVADGPHFSPQYVSPDMGVPILSTRNVRFGSFDLAALKYVSHDDHAEFCRRTRPERDDIIYTKGGTTGIAKLNDLDFEFSVWVHLAVLKIEKRRLSPSYVEMALNSPHCYAQSQRYTQGISNFDLGLTRMIKITIPLPPLAEQHRIVAKVEGLMALCDRLVASLNDTEATRSRLLDALLAEALLPSARSLMAAE